MFVKNLSSHDIFFIFFIKIYFSDQDMFYLKNNVSNKKIFFFQNNKYTYMIHEQRKGIFIKEICFSP